MLHVDRHWSVFRLVVADVGSERLFDATRAREDSGAADPTTISWTFGQKGWRGETGRVNVGGWGAGEFSQGQGATVEGLGQGRGVDWSNGVL